MKTKYGELVLLILVAILLSGCGATFPRITVADNDDLIGVYHVDGTPFLTSSQRHSVGVGSVSPEVKKGLDAPPKFGVMFANNGDQIVDFGPGNIELFVDDIPTPVISPEAYVRAVEKQARAQKMGVAIGAAFQQAGAAMKASTPTYSTTSGTANVYNPNYGSTNVNYRSTTTTYNPSANATAQAIESANINNQLNQNIQQIEAERNKNLETSSELLRLNSVAPNKSIFGVVILPAKKLKTGSRLNVKISVDEEIHVFNFRVDPPDEVD